MKRLNEIIESLKIWYSSQDELARTMIDCIVLAFLALGVAFAFGLSFYFINISL